VFIACNKTPPISIFVTNPLAPTKREIRTISSPACIESIKMGTFGINSLIFFAALNHSAQASSHQE